MPFELIHTGVVQGLLLAFVAFGIMIPFRLLSFPDLTSEGSYPLGGAITALFLINSMPSLYATLLGALAGGIAGILTGLIHLRLKVNTLLAGIIVSTMIYSVNLHLLGTPNVALFDVLPVFASSALCLFGMQILLIIFFFGFLHTEIGLRFYAVGLNPLFASKQNFSITFYTLLGLFIGNAFIALAGSLVIQIQSYMDIGMGVGIVIHALAALMIGESLIRPNSLFRQMIAPFLGALVYQQIQGLVLYLGMPPSDLKLLTGMIVLMILFIRQRGAI